MSSTLWNGDVPVPPVWVAVPTETETGDSKPSESGAIEIIPALTAPADGIRNDRETGLLPSRSRVVVVIELPIPDSSDCQP